MSNVRARTPLVWILKGPKLGDYAQLLALANAIGWPFVTKTLHFRGFELLLHAQRMPTLAALKRAASDPLVPPWPDIVLTAGRRNELVARWIARASQGRTRLVHVGRPWSHPRRFDLVISSRQYYLDDADNVLVNDLPLHELDVASLPALRADWAPHLAHLPRPWTVLLTGGDSGPLVFDTARAAELGRRVTALLARSGGSLLVTTSARTSSHSVAALLNAMPEPGYLHRFGAPPPNPYRALLACGDQFVVTGDSMSMLAEACSTLQPVYVFDFADDQVEGNAGSVLRWKPLVHRLAMTVGPRRMRRDVRRIHRALLAQGTIKLLGAGGDLTAVTPTNGNDALLRSAQRVRALLIDPPSAG